MADPIIFGSEADVGGGGKGFTATELIFNTLVQGVVQEKPAVITGMVASTPASGLVVTLTAGDAFINGYLVRFESAFTVTANANEATADWYLQLVRDGGTNKVTGHTFLRVLNAKSTGDDDPVDSVHLFGADSDTTDVTLAADRRTLVHRWAIGQYAGTGASLSVSLGYQPEFVMINGDGATNAKILALSGLLIRSAGSPGFVARSTFSGHSISKRDRPELTATGFDVTDAASGDSLSSSGNTFIYLALRGEKF